MLCRPAYVLSFLLLLLPALAPAAALPDFSELVKAQSPAVVNISTVSRAEASGHPGLPPGMDPEQLPEIFRHFFRGVPEGPSQRERRSLGSGFIISEDGYVVTNNHVVERADEIFVRLQDRREFEAELVGRDPRSDLALLRIEADDLPTVTLGVSGELEVGEWVLAIGSPFGFDYSVTAGIVSAKERSLPDRNNENYVPFIQTDVAINPGNSGGPLFDLDGRVVGINSQIYTRSGGFMGLSFAIPIDVAMNVVKQLREDGSVARGWLGVMIQDVSRDLAESFGLARPAGALVAQVVPDSPAEAAGLQPGDVIVRFAGESIERSGDLPHVVGLLQPDSEAEVELMRAGVRERLTVTIGTLADPGETAVAGKAASPKDENRLGLTLEPLTDALKQRLQAEEGVVVRSVAEGPAEVAGVRPGDVITRLNNVPVQSLGDFQEAAQNLPAGRSVPMLVVRRGVPVFLALKLPPAD